MENVWRSPIAQHRIRLNRGDIGFVQEAIMVWHEQGTDKRPAFLFKLKLTNNVKKAIAAVRWDDWQGKSNEGLVQPAELKLNGWSCERRVIVERTLKFLNASPQGSFWRQRPKKPTSSRSFNSTASVRMRNGAERHGQERTRRAAKRCDRRGASKRL